MVSTAAVAELAASGGISESRGAKASTTPGTYYYGACVDAASGETDTTNNCSPSDPVTVAREQLPDLLVAAPSVSDGSPARGARFTLSATVTNGGDGPAGATRIRYYRSTDATITTSGTQVGTDAITALAASGSSSESLELTAPTTTGKYYYGACVDAVSDESNAANNCSSAVTVTVPVPVTVPETKSLHPDLEVTLTVNNASQQPGATLNLSATVSNTSDGESPSTTLRYYQSTDATITTSGTFGGNRCDRGACRFGDQRPVDFADGAVFVGLVLLRGVRGQRDGRVGYDEQLLVGGADDRPGVAAEPADVGCEGRLDKPGDGRTFTLSAPVEYRRRRRYATIGRQIRPSRPPIPRWGRTRWTRSRRMGAARSRFH